MGLDDWKDYFQNRFGPIKPQQEKQNKPQPHNRVTKTKKNLATTTA